MINNTYDLKSVNSNRKPRIIAVDFDGTLCEEAIWPSIGEPDVHLIEYLKERQAAGDKLILWTCRSGDHLKAAVNWCATEHSLYFNAVNENLPETLEWMGEDSRKIFAHEYIDDRNASYYPQQVRPQNIAYLCDGKACEKGCPGTECHHTFDIDHAKNFEKLQDGRYMEIYHPEPKITFKPLEDTPDTWIFSHDCDDGAACYRHKDRCSLFKDVYPDGAVKYSDTGRFDAININMATVAYHSGLVSRVMDEMFPIEMPYIPEDESHKVVCENFLVDPKNGDFDTYGIFFVIKPNGGRVEINRYFKDAEDGWTEIDEKEYTRRKLMRLEGKKEN